MSPSWSWQDCVKDVVDNSAATDQIKAHNVQAEAAARREAAAAFEAVKANLTVDQVAFRALSMAAQNLTKEEFSRKRSAILSLYGPEGMTGLVPRETAIEALRQTMGPEAVQDVLSKEAVVIGSR